MGLVAIGEPEQFVGPVVFDAFRDDVKLEAPRHSDRGGDQRPPARALLDRSRMKDWSIFRYRQAQADRVINEAIINKGACTGHGR